VDAKPNVDGVDCRLPAGYDAAMAHYYIAEAAEQLDEMIDRALAGEIVVITRDGVPIVELQPIHEAERPVTSADLAWMVRQQSNVPALDDSSGG